MTKRSELLILPILLLGILLLILAILIPMWFCENSIRQCNESVEYWQGEAQYWENQANTLPVYHNFESEVALALWLKADDTNEQGYIPDGFNCDDFAMMLARNALEDGYFIGLYLTEDYTHAMNWAIAGNKAFLIDPQTDIIRFIAVVD